MRSVRLVVLAVVCLGVLSLSEGFRSQQVLAQAPGGNVAPLMARAQGAGEIRVIVGHRRPAVTEASLPTAEAVAAERADIAEMTRSVLSTLPINSVRGVTEFETIPFFAVTVDAAGLAALAASPLVSSIQEDRAVPPGLTDSVPLVQADQAAGTGYAGVNQTVAILDTGVDSSHGAFAGGRIVSEACYSKTQFRSTSMCPGGVDASTAPGSGVNCPMDVAGCWHGTHVAGIAAGNGGNVVGVAPGANIIAIQVFAEFDEVNDCGSTPSPCALSWVSDQILALERVYALRHTFNISSVNMSLGGDRYFDTATCDADNAAQKAAIDTLRAVGIATVISSGNNGYSNSMGMPGCISSAISVGSTTKADAVSSFSNTASFLALLAPGSSIRSAIPGNGTGTASGTSMAAPHVTGAWAILKQFKPAASVGDILAVLEATGLPITDPDNDLDFARIRIKDAIDSPPLPFGKTSPPSGSTGQDTIVALNWGASAWADTYEFCVDTVNDGNCNTSWVPTGTNTTGTADGLNSGTTYYWQARAVNTGSPTSTERADDNLWWTFTTSGPASNPAMAVDTPAEGATVPETFPITGWAVDLGATSGTGVDTIHIWAHPQGSSSLQFVAVANYGQPRDDVAGMLGPQFRESGYSANASLAPGNYLLLVYSHSTVTGEFSQVLGRTITVTAPASQPATAIDTPQPLSGSLRPADQDLLIKGWALDLGAPTGTGVGTVHVWAFQNGQQPGTFIGVDYGRPRPDVGTAFGNARFNNSGYEVTVPANTFAPGTTWFFVVFGWSTVTQNFTQTAGTWVTFE